MDGINVSLLGRRDKALYGMLLTAARDKCHQDISGDTLIYGSVEYFENHNDKPRLMLASHYAGRARQLNDEPAPALVHFFRARELAGQLGDDFRRGMAARGLSDIYNTA